MTKEISHVKQLKIFDESFEIARQRAEQMQRNIDEMDQKFDKLIDKAYRDFIEENTLRDNIAVATRELKVYRETGRGPHNRKLSFSQWETADLLTCLRHINNTISQNLAKPIAKRTVEIKPLAKEREAINSALLERGVTYNKSVGTRERG